MSNGIEPYDPFKVYDKMENTSEDISVENQTPSQEETPTEQVIETSSETPSVKDIKSEYQPIYEVEEVIEKDYALMVPMERQDFEAITSSVSTIEEKLDESLEKETDPDKKNELQSKINVIKTELSAIVISMMDGIFYNKEFYKTFDEHTDSLSQFLKTKAGKKLMIGYPKLAVSSDVLKSSDNPDILKNYLQSTMGYGKTTRIFLYHSGLIVKLNTFKETEILTLNLELQSIKEELGISTKGDSYSSDEVYVIKHIMDFILDHIIDCNLTKWDTKTLKKLIVVTDIPILLAGALAAMYPNGYPVQHVCMNTEDNCDYIMDIKFDDMGRIDPDSKLKFNRLVWVDHEKVPDECIEFLGEISKNRTIEEVIEYQNKLLMYNQDLQALHAKWVVNTSSDNKIEIYLRPPHLQLYLEESSAIIAKTIRMTNDIIKKEDITNDQDEEERKKEILNLYMTTLSVFRYMSWIHKVVMYDDDMEAVIDGRNGIKTTLEVFSGDTEKAIEFIKRIEEFKEDVSVAYTGLPNFKCPKCGKPQVPLDQPHHELIPVNMVGYFFTILQYRLQKKRLLSM